MAKLIWHGHATCTLVTDGGARLVIDPFFDDNPACSIGVDDVGDVDYVLVTHGHFDHFADCAPLARRTGAKVVSTFEIASFLESEKGVDNVHGMNLGGGHTFDGVGYVKMTPAVHTGSVAGDTEGAYTTDCGGFLVDMGDKTFYHSGDTALIKDMELLRDQVDVAVLPIGDNYTMGPGDAARAVDMIRPRVVIPIHYGTWPVIEQDPEAFRRLVGDLADVVVLEPGDSYEF